MVKLIGQEWNKKFQHRFLDQIIPDAETHGSHEVCDFGFHLGSVFPFDHSEGAGSPRGCSLAQQTVAGGPG